MAAALDLRVQHLLRDLTPQVLGALLRRFRDMPAAEDAVQEALVAAATHWPKDGMPDDPRAWLVRVASRRVIDQVRAEAARRHREELVVSLIPPEEQLAMAADEDGSSERDDTLDLLFMCCHSALSPASAIALTLRAVGGLTTAEIAKTFLVPETTMAQRISRAKQTIKASGVPFETPSPEMLASRLAAVMQVVYLIFNEGYTASFGSDLVRTDLSAEAIRIGRMLLRLVPDHPEIEALLALMLLTDARRAARTGPAGEIVPLDEQDRSLWDREAIAEGARLVTAALARGPVGPYQVQAAIAALHDEAPSTDETDWAEILALYDMLAQIDGGPMVALNRAIAVAMVQGARAGLDEIETLAKDVRLREHHRLFAVRAHLLERAGDRDGAVADFQKAARLATSVPEQSYLLMRAARIRDKGH